MSHIDVKGPIGRHVRRAEQQFDELIDELRYPDPEVRTVVRTERARTANPVYQYGVMFGQLSRAMNDFVETLAQGFSDGNRR